MMLPGTVRVLIVEDEVLIAEYIKELLGDEGYTNVKIAHDRNEAMGYFQSFRPHIILMDININGRNTGIELSSVKNPDAGVIFLTAQSDLATMQRALATEPVSYLTKPLRKTEVMAAIQLYLLKQKAPSITIKDGYNVIKIMQSDILYIKADNIYLDIFTGKKKYTIRQTLEKLVAELEPGLFCKPHRSYVVNRAAITRKDSKMIYLEDIAIPLSRNFSVEL